MKPQWLDLTYSKNLECWMVIQGDTGYLMHCGEWFNLRIGENQGIQCRLELARNWYVVIGTEGVKLSLRTDETYQVEV